MTKQDSLGQLPTTTRGKYAPLQQGDPREPVRRPHAIQFADLKTGVRPKPFYPDLGGTPSPIDPQAAPDPLQRPGRDSTERNGFTGH